MMRDDYVLLLGTSFSAAPLLRHLQSAGLRVAVCGNLRDDPCVSWADAYFAIDYSDPVALRDLVEAERFTAICPSCNDAGYLSSAATAHALGYPGYDTPETTRILHDKAHFRAFASAHGLAVPWSAGHAQPGDLPAGTRYPLLVKPTDAFSGRGVVRVDRAEYLPLAIATARAASRDGKHVVEAFIEGSLHSHSAFLVDAAIAEEYFVDEFCTVYPYQVNCSNSPSRLSPAVRAKARAAVAALVERLRPVDGLLHTQFMVRDDEVFLIECMRRCPGDLYANLIQYSSGATYIDNYLRPFLGRALAPSQRTTFEPWARHTISLREPAIVWSFRDNFPALDVTVFPLRESGALIDRAPFDKLAIVFARFESELALFAATPHLDALVSIQSESHDHAASR